MNWDFIKGQALVLLTGYEDNNAQLVPQSRGKFFLQRSLILIVLLFCEFVLLLKTLMKLLSEMSEEHAKVFEGWERMRGE